MGLHSTMQDEEILTPIVRHKLTSHLDDLTASQVPRELTPYKNFSGCVKNSIST